MTVHQTPGRVVVDIELAAGEIVLHTDHVATTQVDMESLSGDSGEAAIAATDQQCRERDGGHTVRLRVPNRGERKRLFGRDAEVRIVITAPHGTRLVAKTASADIAVTGRLGGLDARTASGDVRTELIEGDATVRTMSGDVRLGAIGGEADVKTMSGDQVLESVAAAATMQTMSGDLTVGHNGDSAEASSMSGDIRLDAVQRGDVDLKSASGDITVGVVRGTRVWMDAQSSSGDADSDLDHTDGGGGSEDEAQLRLRVSTSSGDVRIRRSQRSAEATPANGG